MKKLTILPAFLLLFAISVTSCDTEPVDPVLLDNNSNAGGNNGGDNGGDNNGGPVDGSYWPAAIGNKWQFSQDGSPLDPYKIVDTESIDGHTYYTFDNFMSTSTDGSLTGNASFSIRQDNHNYYVYMGVSASNGATVSGFGYIFLKDNLAVGQSWTQDVTESVSYDIPGLPDMDIPLHIVSTIEGTGMTIDVNGETYNNVIQMSMVQSVSGQQVSENHYWFAKDIGPIKAESDIMDGTTLVQELDSYTLN